MKSDGYLQLRDDVEVPRKETETSGLLHFLNVAEKLPLEIQMKLCNLSQGLRREFIPAKSAEIAFREIFRFYFIHSSKEGDEESEFDIEAAVSSRAVDCLTS